MIAARRDWRIDLVRTIAIIEVVSVHFLSNTGFYSQPVMGMRMTAMIVLRALTITCVPLFMLLTGYLVRGSVTREYYRKILPILLTYVVASLFCRCYSVVRFGMEPSVVGTLFDILTFEAAPYSWYVEMYIGLFLAAPFLGKLWDVLDVRQQKALLLTVVAVLFLPGVLNSLNLVTPGWWADPQSAKELTKVIPAWWTHAYPIGYYFFGRWLRDHGRNVPRRAALGAFLCSVMLIVALDCWKSAGEKYVRGDWNSYSSVLVLVAAVSLFCLVLRLRDQSPRIAPALAWIARLSFGAYLCSWVWDNFFYTKLNASVALIPLRLNWLPVVVPAVLVCSLATSWVIDRFVRTLLALAAPKEGTSPSQPARLARVAALALLCGTALFVLWKCPYGFGNVDESFYLTIPYRLCMGDALVGQEWHLSQLSSVFLVLPMRFQLALWHGTDGVVLHFRYLFAAAWIASAAFIFFRLRKITWWGALAAALAFLLYAPFGIMALSYNSLGILFVTVGSVALVSGRDGPRPGKWAFVAGLCLGCAILCCPYLVALWVVALIYSLPALTGRDAARRRVRMQFLALTGGAALVGVAIVSYLVVRVGPQLISQSIPQMLADPEHPATSLGSKLVSYAKAIAGSSPLTMPLAVVLVTASVVGRVRPRWELAALATSCAAAFVMQQSFVPPYINYVMFPLSLIGLSVRIIGRSRLSNLLFRLVWIPGAVYGLCIHLGSNQRFYVISSAMTVCAIASICMTFVFLHERRAVETEKGMEVGRNLLAGTAVALLVLQLGLLADLRYKSVFWERGMAPQTQRAAIGPERGILMTVENEQRYLSRLHDIEEMRSAKPNGTLLGFTTDTWVYLASPYEVGSYSAWISGLGDSSVERLGAYYEINPHKRPDIVYLDDAADEARVAHLLNGDYQVLRLESGRVALVVDR